MITMSGEASVDSGCDSKSTADENTDPEDPEMGYSSRNTPSPVPCAVGTPRGIISL